MNAMNDERFDRLLQEIRDETVPEEEIRAAQDRVRERLTGPASACEEFRPALADYLAGRLPEARRLLTEDHLGRCVDCRRELRTLKGERKVVPHPSARPSRRRGRWQWVAAAAMVVMALWLGRDAIDSALAPSGPRATVVSLSGTLHRLSGEPLDVGAGIGEGQVVRTAAGSRAVLRMADGSQLEMNQRTELALQAAWSGSTVRLDRGDVIVEAADQGRRELRVVTRDSVASVRGTVFAVSSGTAGSLVSVVEGSVAVTQPGFERVLGAGEQAASSPALGAIGAQQAVAWSAEAAEYAELLTELARIEEQVAAMVWSLRYEPRLVSRLPAHSFAYVAIPNAGGTIGEVVALMDQRARQSPVLDAWWSSGEGEDIRQLLEHLETLTPSLGEEIALVVSGVPGDGGAIPLVMAEVQAGREAELQAALAGLADPDDVAYQVSNGLFLLSDEASRLALLAAQLGSGASSAFAAAIAERYRRGVGLLAALDVAALDIDDEAGPELGDALGLANIRHLFVEQRSGSVGDATEATLSFDGARVGMASWLAEPGAIGAAEYVSPEAVIVAASSTRDPRDAFDQLVAALGPGSELHDVIDEIRQETGVDVGNDIAASLGTDFVGAVERLSVPVPGWLAVAEVLNSSALDQAMRRLVDAANADVPAGDSDRLQFVQESVNGRTWNTLSTGDPDLPSFTWTYDRGYLVAAADRALALRAIGVRDSGASLIRASEFQRQYPVGVGLHSSGFLWVNAADVIEQAAALTSSPAFSSLAGNRDPVLVVVTGEADSIHWASRTRLSSMMLDLMLAGSLD